MNLTVQEISIRTVRVTFSTNEPVDVDLDSARAIKDFLDALPGHLLPDVASQYRSVVVIDRFKAIAGS